MEQLKDLARTIIPDDLRSDIVDFLKGARGKYPLPEPISVNAFGVSAKFNIRNRTDYYRLLLSAGSFEQGFSHDLFDVIGKYAREGVSPVFYDIGSAQGFYSIIAAKLSALVYAIDPDSLSFKALRENYLLNPDVEGKIIQIQVAVSDKPGKTLFFEDSKGRSAPSMVQTVATLQNPREVQQTPLDNLVRQSLILPPDIVKIDVEGAEGLVIDGMSEILNDPKLRPRHVFIELHKRYSLKFGFAPEQVVMPIQKAGYSLTNSWNRGDEILCHYGR